MPEPLPRSPRRPHLLGLAFLLLLAVGSGLAWLLVRQQARVPLRVLLITPTASAASGLEAAQGRAIGALVQDHLEQYGRFAVTSVTEIPDDLAPFRGGAKTLLVALDSRREGEKLDLSYRYAWGTSLGKGGTVPWVAVRAEALPPWRAMDAFLGAFPQAVLAPPGGLLPKTPGVFWDLVSAGAWRLQNARLDEAMALAERATHQEPDCASTWILLGNLRYRWMLDRPLAFRQEQIDTEALLQKGLSLAPGHPRGTLLLSLLKSDRGNQREALELLLGARRQQPHNPSLLIGIIYAARGAGLLPLARRAMDLRDDLAFSQVLPQSVDITCLYTGEVSRFEASLQEQPGHLRSTSGVLPFYRGYLALVRGDQDSARTEFRNTADLTHGYQNIRRLSEIFSLILEGQVREARKKLEAFDRERIGMREPDGEFTIRLAEAYALVGDRAAAMDMASRAFARGFGCTAWYEQSPMLDSLRALPKWKALVQHLRERQDLMEARFPVGLLEAR